MTIIKDYPTVKIEVDFLAVQILIKSRKIIYINVMTFELEIWRDWTWDRETLSLVNSILYDLNLKLKITFVKNVFYISYYGD